MLLMALAALVAACLVAAQLHTPNNVVPAQAGIHAEVPELVNVLEDSPR
jgi:hypothetical protein